MRMLAGCVLGACAVVGLGVQAQKTSPAGAAMATRPDSDVDDKYIWLEDANGDRAMAWVKAENAKSAAVLSKDPHFQTFYDEALAIAEDPHKLAYPQLIGDMVYNQWRDRTNPRGLLRRTTLADYLTAAPHWQTVLDVDVLGKAEGVGWVLRGRSCLYPGDRFCMIELSAGGEDAVTMREFDLKEAKFVPGGFTLPHSKQNAQWLDKDTLMVERDWGGDALTASGYPYITKIWKRGTPLESATEVFRGQKTDVSAGGNVLRDEQGDRLETFRRGVSFFESQTYVRTPRGIERLAIPAKSNLGGVLAGNLLVEVREDWTPGPGMAKVPAGALVSLTLADVERDPAHLKPAPVFTPTADEFLDGFTTTRDRLLVTTLKHVQGRAYVYTPGSAGWTHAALALPQNVAVGIAAADRQSGRFFVDVTGFLTPSALWQGDTATRAVSESKSQPAQFDASHDTVEQFEATSKDGTHVPYFVVHPEGMKLDGTNPTLLYAYGGFEVSETPNYSGTLGKLWLERGGVYVLANIRGGGEFGPAWHDAGLNVHRQRIYDDFAAVGQDLIARHITSTPHLGIQGGSNGGLLMGVEMTQHPELWNAVVIQVPLLDMLRFEKIAAGASWVGEYGSVSVPEQRAFLAGISPYNQLKPGVKYPEPLIFTTTKDDRVGPQHARKFAAKMEEYKLPFFYDEITEGGHGAGADLKQIADSTATTFVYLERKLR